MKKKKILFQTDFSLAKTGFGRNAKTVLSYLYKTGKYDLVHYCVGMNMESPDLKRTPWKSIGCVPNSPNEIENLNRDPNMAKIASYGGAYLDEVIKQEKPDIYIASQDIWGVDFAISKRWFKNLTSVIWTTLDSLPILPSAIEAAKAVENYWIWSSFATQELNRMGYDQVKTFHGPIDHSFFFPKDAEFKSSLRRKFNIPLDSFIVGFVFRNQLRKSVPNLIEGYSKWRRETPLDRQTFLLLHTNFFEGWNIPRLATEYKVPETEILTTYICKKCKQYDVRQFSGKDMQCPYCLDKESFSTIDVMIAPLEEQLNEIYNLMDVYCHPFTSGGQEIPIQEAKLTELITLVTNYSCGEEMCHEEAASLPLDWSEYREHGTEFRKASTDPNSIAKQINKVYNMPPTEKKKLEEQARKWTIENYSIKKLGPKLEEFFDKAPFVDYESFSIEEEKRDPNYTVPAIADDSAWLIDMYRNILKMPHVNENDEGHKYWMAEIRRGLPRPKIEQYFRNVAVKENSEFKPNEEKMEGLDDDDEGRRILYVMPENERDVFLSTSLFKSIKDQYPEHNLYVATNPVFFSILNANPYVHKTIKYDNRMDNLFWLEGRGSHKGFFEVAFTPYVNTKQRVTYTHNGKDNIAFDLKCT